MVKKMAKNKKGFSIAEALISMLIISIFFIATSKVMTTKQRTETWDYPHGFYECYVSNAGILRQRMVTELNVSEVQQVERCNFNPPRGIAVATIYAVRNSSNITVAAEPQFNNRLIMNRNQLENFDNNLDVEDTEENTFDINDMRHFLETSYPNSSFLSAIRDGSYSNGPALFIGW